MKSIIINESDKEIINKFLKTQKLSKKILLALKHNKTSLGQNPSFPPEQDLPFDKKVTIERFEEIKDSLKDIVGDIDDFSEKNLTNILSRLTKECVEKETPIRKELEKICINTLNDLFDIPNEIIIYKCKLTNKVKSNSHALRLTPENYDDFEFTDVLQIEDINNEIYKRRVINALIIGASMYYSRIMAKSYLSDIFELNPKLPELYSKLIKINNLLLFIKDDIKLTDTNPQQGGIVNVTLGNEDTKTIIDVQAMNFPILLSESIRGFMELFASHGLPKDRNSAIYVTKKADFLIAEPWDMRMGPVLWDYFINSIGDIDNKLMPNIFEAVVELPSDEFFKLMREIFGQTKKGRDLMSKIVEDVKNDIEYTNFNNRLSLKRDDTINDEFFNPDELITNNLNESRHKSYGGFKYLKKHMIPLTDDEINFFKKKGIVWPSGDVIIHKAKAKNEKDGEIYFAWTHRAWAACKTKTEAVRIGKFIESTA